MVPGIQGKGETVLLEIVGLDLGKATALHGNICNSHYLWISLPQGYGSSNVVAAPFFLVNVDEIGSVS